VIGLPCGSRGLDSKIGWRNTTQSDDSSFQLALITARQETRRRTDLKLVMDCLADERRDQDTIAIEHAQHLLTAMHLLSWTYWCLPNPALGGRSHLGGSQQPVVRPLAG
jgi:hypothetical protein